MKGLLKCWGLSPIAMSRNFTRRRANWIRHYITAYCIITRSNLERSMCVKDLDSFKIITQSILDTFARGTFITKTKITDVLASILSGLKSYWSGMEWTWSKIQRKITHKSSSLLISLAGKLGWTISSLPSVIGGKNADNLWSNDSSKRRWSFWWIKRLRSVFYHSD